MVLQMIAALAVARWPSRGADTPDDDAELLARLQAGDEAAFTDLVARHHGTMLRLASLYVPNRAVAEEVVQDTWLGVVRGIDRFAGRSSIRTWLLAILVNRARSTGVREQRSVAVDDASPSVERSRFDASGMWSTPPAPWPDDSDDRLTAAALGGRLRTELERLPVSQREVLLLRDVDGLDADEVSAVLSISRGNQRVLLHRGRSRLRAALESDLGGAA